jgi:photosystem II stability/assembly factor-like uncharacterized protein
MYLVPDRPTPVMSKGHVGSAPGVHSALYLSERRMAAQSSAEALLLACDGGDWLSARGISGSKRLGRNKADEEEEDEEDTLGGKEGGKEGDRAELLPSPLS